MYFYRKHKKKNKFKVDRSTSDYEIPNKPSKKKKKNKGNSLTQEELNSIREKVLSKKRIFVYV